MNPASNLFCSSGALILLHFSCFSVFTLKECQASLSEKHVTSQTANGVKWSFFEESEDCKPPSCSNGRKHPIICNIFYVSVFIAKFLGMFSKTLPESRNLTILLRLTAAEHMSLRFDVLNFNIGNRNGS